MSWDFGVNATFQKNNVSELASSIPTGSLKWTRGHGDTGTGDQECLPINAFVTRQFISIDKELVRQSIPMTEMFFYYVGNPTQNLC
jgi:hypothetical protein